MEYTFFFLDFFHQLVYPCSTSNAMASETHSLLVFVGKCFTPHYKLVDTHAYIHTYNIQIMSCHTLSAHTQMLRCAHLDLLCTFLNSSIQLHAIHIAFLNNYRAYSEEVAEFNTDNVGGKHYRITPLTIELRPDSKGAEEFELHPAEVHSPHRASIYTLPHTISLSLHKSTLNYQSWPASLLTQLSI